MKSSNGFFSLADSLLGVSNFKSWARCEGIPHDIS